MLAAESQDDQREKALTRIHGLAVRYAKAQAEREYLDDFKKSKLSILMRRYECEGFETVSAQEREARADKEYIELLEGLRAAVEQAELLRWELRMEEWKFDAWRTRMASKRAEMQRYGA